TDRGIVLRRGDQQVLEVPYTNIAELEPIKTIRKHFLLAVYSIFAVLYSIIGTPGESFSIVKAIILFLTLVGALGTTLGVETFLMPKGFKIHMVSGETLQISISGKRENLEAMKLIEENINKTYGLIS
ncbi:MAG: hypothetical protein DRO11_09160, partial [Methanobacteriota archaeon]